MSIITQLTTFVNSYRLFSIILIVGVILLPFVYWPWYPIPYELPRVWFVSRWIELLVFCGLIFRFKLTPLNWRISLVLGIFIMFLFISSTYGVSWITSLWGNPYRQDGLVTQLHLFSLSLLIGLWFRPVLRVPFALALSLGAVGVSLWAISDAVKLNLYHLPELAGWSGAVGATFGQPNFLAGYLVVSLPWVWYLQKTAPGYLSRTLWAFSLPAILIALSLTWSWGSLGSVVILAGLIMYFRYKKLSRFPKVILFIFLIALGIFSWRWWTVSQLSPQITAESRPRIFMKGLLAWQQRPILGWGWANFDSAFRSIDWPYHFEIEPYVDKAHSEILEILTTTGLMGLATYLLLIWQLLRQALLNLSGSKGRDQLWWQTIILTLIVYLIHSQTNVVAIAEQVVFYLTIGFLLSSPRLQKLSTK